MVDDDYGFMSEEIEAAEEMSHDADDQAVPLDEVINDESYNLTSRGLGMALGLAEEIAEERLAVIETMSTPLSKEDERDLPTKNASVHSMKRKDTPDDRPLFNQYVDALMFGGDIDINDLPW